MRARANWGRLSRARRVASGLCGGGGGCARRAPRRVARGGPSGSSQSVAGGLLLTSHTRSDERPCARTLSPPANSAGTRRSGSPSCAEQVAAPPIYIDGGALRPVSRERGPRMRSLVRPDQKRVQVCVCSRAQRRDVTDRLVASKQAAPRSSFETQAAQPLSRLSVRFG